MFMSGFGHSCSTSLRSATDPGEFLAEGLGNGHAASALASESIHISTYGTSDSPPAVPDVGLLEPQLAL